MAKNYIKFMALNTVHPMNSDENKPKKTDVIKHLVNIFNRSNQELYSPHKVDTEFERLISTGQIIIKPDNSVVSGTIIFEEGEDVSHQANELSKSIFKQLKNNSNFSSTIKTMEDYVIEEMINSMAVIIDKNISKNSRKVYIDEDSLKA